MLGGVGLGGVLVLGKVLGGVFVLGGDVLRGSVVGR